MIHSKMVKPRVFPWNSARVPEQIDRLQEITGDLALNRDKLYEIGRVGLLDYRKRTPSLTGSFKQFENGSMAFWRDLANVVDPGSGVSHIVDLDDLKTTKSDITAFLTDDDATFTGSIRFPSLRLTGFSLNIADPDAMLERTFNVISEGYDYLDGKYFAYQSATVSAPGSKVITLSPAAVEYSSGKYIFRVLRVRAGVVTELVEDATGLTANTWKYATGDVTVLTCLASDLIKVYYASATAYATTWTDNDADSSVLLAEYCEIYLKVGTSTKIYKLQSVGIDVTFERSDYKEIGNDEVVQTGVKNTTVKISLSKFQEGFSLEDIFASDTTYPYINPADFADTIQMMVKIYDSKEHNSFKIGYLISEISPTSIGNSVTVEEYLKSTSSLETDNLIISDEESDIIFS